MVILSTGNDLEFEDLDLDYIMSFTPRRSQRNIARQHQQSPSLHYYDEELNNPSSQRSESSFRYSGGSVTVDEHSDTSFDVNDDSQDGMEEGPPSPAVCLPCGKCQNVSYTGLFWRCSDK